MTHDFRRLKKSFFERWDKLTHPVLKLIKKHQPTEQGLPENVEEILTAHNENFYEHNPTAPRSSETSELQDSIGNFNRGPEVEAYEKKNQHP